MPATSVCPTHYSRRARSLSIQSLSTFALVYCFVVMVAAYTARGASGFGAAVAMPLLALVMPLKVLVPAWTLVGIAAGAALLGEDRKNVAWKEMLKLVPGCFVGIAVGLYVFTLYRPKRWRSGSASRSCSTGSIRSPAHSAPTSSRRCRRASRRRSAASAAA